MVSVMGYTEDKEERAIVLRCLSKEENSPGLFPSLALPVFITSLRIDYQAAVNSNTFLLT
jgi:hypothetical protein